MTFRKLLFAFSFLLGASSCASFLPASDPAQIVRGPLSTRQQHPLALTMMAFRPRRPVTQAKGELAGGMYLAWASIEEIQQFSPASPNESVVFDGETIRGTLRGRYGLGDKLDIELEVPFLWAGGGGIDSLVEDFHDLFFLPSGGRQFTEDDQFRMNVTSEGELLYSLEGNSIRLQDVPVFLTYQLTEEARGVPALAARVGLELPLGSQDRGYGNGALDYGVGVIGEKSNGRWTLSGGLDYVSAGDSDRLKESSDHHFEPQMALSLAGEFRWDDDWSLVAGLVWTSRMLRTIPLEEINREVFDLGVGFIADTGTNSRLAFSFHEDLVAATGTDLSFQLGWLWGY
jgi:hypothetical protein